MASMPNPPAFGVWESTVYEYNEDMSNDERTHTCTEPTKRHECHETKAAHETHISMPGAA